MAHHETAARPILHPYWRGAAAFAFVVGLGILAIWAWLLLTNNVPELSAQPLDTWIHIATEVGTATLLLAAGAGLITHQSWARRLYLVATGALLFTVVHAVSFYGARGNTGMAILFLVLAVLAIFFAMRAEE